MKEKVVEADKLPGEAEMSECGSKTASGMRLQG
jgi:hypothetical protein